jgi:hypothetical protein
VATGIVTLVIAFAKFDRGAWIVVILVPVMVLGFLRIRAYYRKPRYLQLTDHPLPKADVVFVPILSHQPIPPLLGPHQPARAAARPHSQEISDAWNWEWPQVLSRELAYAARIAPELRIVRVVEDRQEADDFCAAWNAYMQPKQSQASVPRTQVEVLLSPYRTIVLPLANFLIWQQQHEFPGKKVAVMLPREQQQAWWEWPLQRGAAMRVRSYLQRQHSTLLLIDLPYTLRPPSE